MTVSSAFQDGKRVKNTFSSVLGRRRRQNFSPAALKRLIWGSFLLFKQPAAGEKNFGVFWGFKNGLVNKNAPPPFSPGSRKGGAILITQPAAGENF